MIFGQSTTVANQRWRRGRRDVNAILQWFVLSLGGDARIFFDEAGRCRVMAYRLRLDDARSNSMLQNVLQIDNPKLVATGVADGDGIATVSGLIPTFRRWQTLVFQAVVRDTCEISNFVVQTIQ